MDILDRLNRPVVSLRHASYFARAVLIVMFGESVFSHLQHYPAIVDEMTARGIVFAEFLLPLSLVIEIAGIVALLTGFGFRMGIVLLVGFVALASVLFFPFWCVEGAQNLLYRQQFFKNFALIGLLVLLYSLGNLKGKSPAAHSR